MKPHYSKPADIAFWAFNTVFLGAVIALALIPILHVISVSLSDVKAVTGLRVSLYPIGFSFKSFMLVLEDFNFFRSLFNSVIYTVSSTAVALLLTTSGAYALSKKRIRLRSLMMKFIIVTMIVHAPLIPSFLLVNKLGMYNTIWAIIIPGSLHTYNLIIMRAFFNDIPDDLEDAAEIDGLSPIGVLVRIVLPTSTAILATITLFYLVDFWNSWFRAFLYLSSRDKQPLTIYLRNILEMYMGGKENIISLIGGIQSKISHETMKAATIVLVSFPIAVTYPFLQKYFVRGVMIGAIKG